MAEDVDRQVVVERSDPASVDTEEEAELLCEILLLDIGARFRWNPEFLWISLREK